MRSGSRYIALSDGCVLRRLEPPCVYDRRTDELYELGDEAAEFLRLCDGTRTLRELGCEPGGGFEEDADLLDYCFAEGILTASDRPSPRIFRDGKSPPVSLRYLEFQITSRCNLRCRHCYIDLVGRREMEALDVFRVMDE
ncbi:MAG: hypothetical protein HZC51_12540, partial [Nitrospirae bacterium]|nr:hypothetical protein [Nitrospirota bacterium]